MMEKETRTHFGGNSGGSNDARLYQYDLATSLPLSNAAACTAGPQRTTTRRPMRLPANRRTQGHSFVLGCWRVGDAGGGVGAES